MKEAIIYLLVGKCFKRYKSTKMETLSKICFLSTKENVKRAEFHYKVLYRRKCESTFWHFNVTVVKYCQGETTCEVSSCFLKDSSEQVVMLAFVDKNSALMHLLHEQYELFMTFPAGRKWSVSVF